MTTMHIPEHWTPEQALAVFEMIDAWRDAVWARYGPDIQEACRAEQGDSAYSAAGQIDWLRTMEEEIF